MIDEGERLFELVLEKTFTQYYGWIEAKNDLWSEYLSRNMEIF